MRSKALFTTLLLLALGVAPSLLYAAEGGSPAPDADEAAESTAPARRARAGRPTPEERRKALEDWKQKHPEAAAKVEEFQKMTPEQRRAAVEEFRKAHPQATNRMEQLRRDNALTPGADEAQRAARRQEINAQLEARKAALEKRKKDGPLSTVEEAELKRLDEYFARLKKAAELGTNAPAKPPGSGPLRKPIAPTPATKPSPAPPAH